jgi:hypothetical protein
MIPINDIFDFVIIAGVLTLAVLVAVARRRIFRSNERVKIRPSGCFVLSDSPPNKDRLCRCTVHHLSSPRGQQKRGGLRPNT